MHFWAPVVHIRPPGRPLVARYTDQTARLSEVNTMVRDTQDDDTQRQWGDTRPQIAIRILNRVNVAARETDTARSPLSRPTSWVRATLLH